MLIKRSPGLPRGFPLDADDSAGLILRPTGLLAGSTAREAVSTGQARYLAGGPLAFVAVEVFLHRDDEIAIVGSTLASVEEWAAAEGGVAADAVASRIQSLSSPRNPIADLPMTRSRLMGVVNVTPDSFYDGGRSATEDAAVAHGRALHGAGADILDIGGESTRPGSDPVSEQEEMDRVLPVIERLAGDGMLVSVDTRRAAVMRAACEAGARIINDVSALTEPGTVDAAADANAAVVLMHMQGVPRSMQDDPVYDHAPYQVLRFLMDRVDRCTAAGIRRDAIMVDPGIGFGKTAAHNLQILEQLALLHATGCAVVFGASRKRFIGAVAARGSPDDRLPGSLAVATLAAAQGAQIHRVHDIAETRQALAMVDALAGQGPD